MDQASDQEPRPVYRHLVVNRKGSSNLLADPEKLKKAMRQLREVEDGAREEVDPELASLVKRDYLHRTMKKVYGESYEPPKDVRSDGAIVVATLNQVHIPGGNEPLPLSATFWTQAAHFDDLSPQDAFLDAALALQKRFEEYSDAKFKLLGSWERKSSTLVTVAYSPIVAYSLPDRGFEVGMEFTQKTRFGRVDVGDFEVESEEGRYPIKVPSDSYMMMLMKTAGEIGGLRGFLNGDEQSPGHTFRPES